MTAAVVVLAMLQGVLLPLLMLATGALVGALNSSGSLVFWLCVIGVFVTVQHLLDPFNAELGAMLWRRVDESLSQRVMRALATPPGLSHVEDPAVLDAAVQVEGALTGTTPGEAAAHLGFFVQTRVTAAGSLLQPPAGEL